MTIDLHTHSTVSDGTDPPAAVVTRAAELGVTVLGLTEHDTTPWLDARAAAGWTEALEVAAGAGVTLVPGAEISCHWWRAGRRHSAHLLAYLFRSQPDLDAGLEAVLTSRATRMEQMVERARRLRGVDIALDDVRAVALRSGAEGEPVLGRPHLARVLVERGVCDTVAEAFGDEWLGKGGDLYVRKASLPLDEAVGLVRLARGVTVLAHPARSGYEVPDSVIDRAFDAGLDGVEADHPWHDARERERLARLAESRGRLVTGSSDYHGATKPELPGACVTRPDAFDGLVTRAAERGGLAPVPPGGAA